MYFQRCIHKYKADPVYLGSYFKLLNPCRDFGKNLMSFRFSQLDIEKLNYAIEINP